MARQAYVFAGGVAGGMLGGPMGEEVGRWTAEQIVRDAERSENPLYQKKMAGQANKKANNALVGKSVSVIKGSRKLKKRKTVHVPDLLRKQIKQVAKGLDAHGTFIKTYDGLLAGAMNANTTRTTGNAGVQMGTTPGQAAWIAPSYQDPNGLMTLQNVMCFANGTNKWSVTQGWDLNYFTIGKIWDAVSVLFNNKDPSMNPYSLTGNMSTISGDTLGTIPTPVNSVPGSLQIDIKSSSVTWRMKNVSQRTLNVDIWECTPTLKFQDVYPLQSMVSAVTTGFTVSNGSNNYEYDYVHGWGTFDKAKAGDYFIMDPASNAPALLKQYGFNFKVVKRTMVMAPQETCIHTIVGPSGTLDMAKTITEATQKYNMIKGFSVGCIVGIRGDQVYGSLGANGRLMQHDTPSASYAQDTSRINCPIALEVEERYNVRVPEIAGFLPNRVDINPGTQTLNLRKHKTVIFNSCKVNSNMTGVGAGYEVYNEENAAAIMDTDLV